MSLLEPGYRLARYELLCKIGQGGMASVWLARTKSSAGDEVFVAVKTLIPEHAANEELRAMMLDEAKIVMAIDHPNVVRTLEVGQLFDMPYLVLEYVAGESVEQLCEALEGTGRTVPPSIVSRIVADTCAGIHAAHELTGPDGMNLGIVHRDVSPHNLLVDESGCVRLIDFGVAMAKERITPETASGVMKGKVPYMAPEHALGEDVDRRADVWALGAVAYVLLSGHYPFDGPNDAARIIRKLTGEPPSALPDSVTPAMSHVVLRALSHEKEVRYQTAADMAKAISAACKPATHEEVATFFRENLGTAMRARSLIVENALAAASARAHAREILDGRDMRRSPHPSNRPPPVSFEENVGEASTIIGVSNGNGSSPPPPMPAKRQWATYLGAGGVALLVMIAFAMGSLTGRDTPKDKVDAATTIASGQPTTNTTSTAAQPSATAPVVITPSAATSTQASAAPSASAVPWWLKPGAAKTAPPPPPPSASATAPKPSATPPPPPSATARPPKEDTIY